MQPEPAPAVRCRAHRGPTPAPPRPEDVGPRSRNSRPECRGLTPAVRPPPVPRGGVLVEGRGITRGRRKGRGRRGRDRVAPRAHGRDGRRHKGWDRGDRRACVEAAGELAEHGTALPVRQRERRGGAASTFPHLPDYFPGCIRVGDDMLPLTVVEAGTLSR